MSTKPRIVREAKHWSDGPLREDYDGLAYLALPWPEDCPYTPERVMAACERHGWEAIGVPRWGASAGWFVPVTCGGVDTFCALTSEFMAEPKRCAHECCDWKNGPHGRRCALCGVILSDRRHGERRKGERRRMDKNLGDDRRGHIKTWYRPERPDRRTGKDRRKEEPRD